MPFARVLPTEHLHMLPIGKFEDPKMRLGVHQIQTQHALIELRQSLGVISTRPAPAKTPNVHARLWTPHNEAGHLRSAPLSRLS